jgi:hypothetical protein
LFFALPCLLFRFGANTPIAQLLDVPLFIMRFVVCSWSALSWLVA